MGCKVKELESSLTTYTHDGFGRVGFVSWGISLVLVKAVPSWHKGFVVPGRFCSSIIIWNDFRVKAFWLLWWEGSFKAENSTGSGDCYQMNYRSTTSCDMKVGMWWGLWEGWHYQTLHLITLGSEIKTFILEDIPQQSKNIKIKF